MMLASNFAVLSARDQAAIDINTFEHYHKGYKRVQEDDEEEEIVQFNEDLKARYDDDPRLFWNDQKHRLALGSSLVELARYMFSIRSSSAGPEREFSRMGFLLSPRRSRYTASNTNKRLTLANLIPQKRRLEEELTSRMLKGINFSILTKICLRLVFYF